MSIIPDWFNHSRTCLSGIMQGSGWADVSLQGSLEAMTESDGDSPPYLGDGCGVWKEEVRSVTREVRGNHERR